MLVVRHDFIYYPDLGVHRGYLEHLDDDVAADAECDRPKFGGFELRGRGSLCDARFRATEDIEVVTDFRARRIGGK